MLSPLIAYFNNFLSLTEEEIDFLKQNIPVVYFESNQFLLKKGQVSSAFYFIIEGTIRMYYLVDGVEKTTFFYQEKDFVSSYESFTKQSPAKHFFQAIEKSVVAVFNASIVAEIIKKFPRFEILSRVIMEQELIVYQDMVASFITMNAEQRYVSLVTSNAQLLQKIPQYHIATYLGVSPETLSRIKNRIQQKRLLDDRQ